MTKTVEYFIGGKKVSPKAGARYRDVDPATGKLLAEVAMDELAAADAAVASAEGRLPGMARDPGGRTLPNFVSLQTIARRAF